MRILAFDPSKSCGIALLEDGVLRNSWLFISPDADNGEVYRSFLNQVKLTMMWNIPDLVVLESYFVGKFHNGADVNYTLRGLIELAAADAGKPVQYVSPTEWKKFVAGRSTATIEQKKMWGAKSNKQFIIKALEDRFGVTLPPMVGLRGKEKSPPSDCYDAIGIALCAAQSRERIESTVEKIEVIRG